MRLGGGFAVGSEGPPAGRDAAVALDVVGGVTDLDGVQDLSEAGPGSSLLESRVPCFRAVCGSMGGCRAARRHASANSKDAEAWHPAERLKAEDREPKTAAASSKGAAPGARIDRLHTLRAPSLLCARPR